MNTVDVLDRLIATSIDSEKRYRHAANDVERASLETFFKWQADNRKAAADELHVLRNRMGGDGKEHGTMSGFADRMEMDFSVIMSKGDTGVVDWCRADDHAVVREYEQALKEDLGDDLRRALVRQLAQIRGATRKLEEILEVFGTPRS